MSKFFYFCTILLISTGCAVNKKTNQINYPSYKIETNRDYSEVIDFTIYWNEIFSIASDNYYVYFYSTTCSHCENLKNWIIEKALEDKNIYFVSATYDLAISNDTSNTIGLSSTNNFFILGYPSLIQINNHILTKNVAGITAIKNLLCSLDND